MTQDRDPIGSARDEAASPGIAKSRLPTSGEQPGDVIGRYKLLQEIGQGGMGSVWMAEQTEPVKRKVALKIIKLGMDTREVVARFEAERQALALMDHPNISKVLDGGATDQGRPFFVMELVRGVPITEYCDKARLGVRERLELFTHVCGAIQHAHHKGIIHRDIKPSNVMVTLHDGVAVPKVIDFGIAKATHAELTQRTVFTRYAQMIGTPEYMSPEQAELSGLDIDTRADVYSLGVLLYELLTGTKPFDMRELLEEGYDELLRTIREVDPATPSTRVSTLGQAASPIAQKRRVDAARLRQHLRGDLDWIVMKCLEKDRSRRYETANGLAADLLRHLRDEPVTAASPGTAYKLRKFVKRNRAKVIAASAVLAALLIAIVGTSWGLIEKSRARSAKLLRQLEDEQRSSLENARLGRNAEAVGALLGQCDDALRAGDASKATVALDAARKRAADGGADGAAGRLTRLVADLDLLHEFDAIDQFTWTWVDGSFANPADAATRDHEALRRYGADPEFVSVEDAVERVDTSAIRGRVVLVLNWLFLRESDQKERGEALHAFLSRVDSDAFRDEFRDAVIGHDQRKLVALAGDPALLEQPPEFTAALGQTKLIPVERRRDLMEMAALRRPSDLALLMALQGTYRLGKPETANERIRWLQAALAADPQNFAPYINLGTALTDAQRLDEAAACDRKAIEIAPQNLKAQGLTNLGVVLSMQGKLDEAIACDRKAIEFDPTYADAHFNMGLLLSQQGKSDDAIACYHKNIELVPKYARVHGCLAEELWKIGQREEAVASYRKAIELDPKWGVACKRLAELFESLGRPEEAIPCWRKNIELEPTAYAHACLGNLLRKKGQLDEAIALFRKAIEIDPKYDAYGGLGVTLKQKGQTDEAIVLMRKSLELRPEHAAGMRVLGETLLVQGQTDEALSWFQKAVALDPKDAEAWMDLGATLDGKGRIDEAIACQRKAIELKPGDFRFHHNLGASLAHAGRHAEAVPSYRKSIELDPNNAQGHLDLAMALQNSGQRDAAQESFRRSIDLDPTRSPTKAIAQYNVGAYLKDQRRFDEAIACYREAVESDPNFAEAHCNLGQCLLFTGRYAEALQSYRRGHELGSKLPDWPYPSAEWVRGAEIKAALEAKLPAILAGESEPVDNAERLECAAMCALKGLHRAVVELTLAAFANDPALADDLGTWRRYNAACAAAQASTGRGKDAAQLDDRERARLRKQALDWLRADLALHARRLQSGQPDERAATKDALREWQGETDLASIRDPAELASLPAADRDALAKLWADVAALLAGASR